MTIPDDVHELPSMRAILASRGEGAADLYQCPNCPRVQEDLFCTDDLPMILVEGPEGAEFVKLHRFVCATCASGPHRTALAEQNAAILAALPAWDGDAGTLLKIERDRLVAASLWADAPGSPLSPACQAEWAAWRLKMHRLTIDFANPGEAVIPEQPALVYGD